MAKFIFFDETSKIPKEIWKNFLKSDNRPVTKTVPTGKSIEFESGKSVD